VAAIYQLSVLSLWRQWASELRREQRLRQIEAKALRKLRNPSRSERLRSFLDQES